MRILRAADHKRMPWKNGGGETTEIAVFPDSAGLSDFDWRVSVARIDGDGPFSSFPGIDRTLAILKGAGIILDIERQAPQRLTLESAPLAFPADVATSATLVDGTVIDFNVMSRRGALAHTVVRLRTDHSSAGGNVRLVLCSRGPVQLSNGARQETLDPRDAAVIDRSEVVELGVARDSEYYLVEFRSV